jgi:hypothetical protein
MAISGVKCQWCCEELSQEDVLRYGRICASCYQKKEEEYKIEKSMRLTEKEKQVLLVIITNKFQPLTNGDTKDLEAEDVVDKGIWYLIHSDVKHIKGFENKRTLAGVMSSLVKKELAGCTYGNGKDGTCWITQKGYEAVKKFI